MGAIIDPCGSNGVNQATMQYVQDEINRAVIEAGAITPDIVEEMIEASLEVVNLNTATDEKLSEVYADPEKYICTYTYEGHNFVEISKLSSGSTLRVNFVVYDPEVNLTGARGINLDKWLIFIYDTTDNDRNTFERHQNCHYQLDAMTAGQRLELKERLEDYGLGSPNVQTNLSISWRNYGTITAHQPIYTLTSVIDNETYGKALTGTCVADELDDNNISLLRQKIAIDDEGEIVVLEEYGVNVRNVIEEARNVVNINTASQSKLAQVYTNPEKYVLTYTFGDRTYHSAQTWITSREDEALAVEFTVESEATDSLRPYDKDRLLRILIQSDGTWEESSHQRWNDRVYCLNYMTEEERLAMKTRILSSLDVDKEGNCVVKWRSLITTGNLFVIGSLYQEDNDGNLLITGGANYFDNDGTPTILTETVQIDTTGQLTLVKYQLNYIE